MNQDILDPEYVDENVIQRHFCKCVHISTLSLIGLGLSAEVTNICVGKNHTLTFKQHIAFNLGLILCNLISELIVPLLIPL